MNQNDGQIDVMIMGGPVAVREALKKHLSAEPSMNVVEYKGDGGPICALSALSPDAVIMDLDGMPVIDGMSFSNWVRKTHQWMGIILMMPIGEPSSDEDEAYGEREAGEVQIEGASGDLDDLIAAVHAVSRGESHIAIYGYRVRHVAVL